MRKQYTISLDIDVMFRIKSSKGDLSLNDYINTILNDYVESIENCETSPHVIVGETLSPKTSLVNIVGEKLFPRTSPVNDIDNSETCLLNNKSEDTNNIENCETSLHVIVGEKLFPRTSPVNDIANNEDPNIIPPDVLDIFNQ